MNYILILMLFVIRCESSPKLVFSDEINPIDWSQWEAIELYDKPNQCDIQTNGEKTKTKAIFRPNFHESNGTLALALIKDKNTTEGKGTPFLITSRDFTYGTFEIRAALPTSKMVRSLIFFIGEQNKGKSEIVLVNQNAENMMNGVIYSYNNELKRIGMEFIIEQNLNDFHTYVLEWTQSEISWSIDGNNLHKFNTSKASLNNDNPFAKPFSLGFASRYLTPDSTSNGKIDDQGNDDWDCSLLILDYVRVYQDEIEETSLSTIASPPIVITSEPKEESKGGLSTMSLIAIISVSGLLFLLALIPLYVLLVILLKKRREASVNQEIQNNKAMEMYDDYIDPDATYEVPNYSNRYETVNTHGTEQEPYLTMINKNLE